MATLRTQQAGATYDVCVVGSGAAGGMAAWALTNAGANVVVLEAGGPWDNATDSAMMKWNYESPRRGGGTRYKPFGEFLGCVGGWELEGEPYTRAAGTNFNWWRARMVGGRTNSWGRISLRFGPDDFRRGELDGLSPSWPIGYDDVAPWYDRVDRLVGLFGSAEGLRDHPDGIFQPPPRPRAHELLVIDASKRLNVPCIPSRLSILTRPLGNRQACHWCGECGRGCGTYSSFSSTNVLLDPAKATKRMTLLTNAMAREVTLDARGRATGVAYVDKTDGSIKQVRARAVVLAASALESVRLLMNSSSSRFPQGLANSSGVLGKYLTDTTGTGVSGFIPKLVGRKRYNDDGIAGGHVYMPWWLDNAKLDFPRGYHIEVSGGLGMPGSGFMGGIQRYPNGGGWGAKLKDDYRRYYGTTIGFAGRGEMIPNEDTYCELDTGTVDRWGIPVLRFHWKWTDHEYNQVRHMQQTFRALVEAMGGQVWSAMPTREQGYGISTGGSIIHELGGARMGRDASKSVTNGYGRTHDVPNLFLADGATFPSQADKNPTWTMMALAWRQAEHLMDLSRRGEL